MESMALGTSTAGDDNVLTFSQIVTCPECDYDFDQIFTAIGQDVEQLQDPPEAECKCTECDHEWTETFGGWLQYGYA